MGTGTGTNRTTPGGLASPAVKVPGEIILQAVMGSHAYGMNHAGSDEDRKGVYVSSTVAVAGLNPPKETVVKTNPDFEFHEIGKFIRLALKCNPTVLEQLYVTHYETLNPYGSILVENRTIFLSKRRIAGAFGGYAMDQFERLKKRGDGTFSSDTKNRTEKHARHMFRLLDQGRELLTTGTLTVKVADSERLFDLGRLPPNEMSAAFNAEDDRFNKAYEESTLPEHGDHDKAAELLAIIRANHL